MRCPNCNKEIPDHLNYCTECGFKLSAEKPTKSENSDITTEPGNASYTPSGNTPPEKPDKNKNNKKIIFGTLGGLLLLFIIISAVGGAKKNSSDAGSAASKTTSETVSIAAASTVTEQDTKKDTDIKNLRAKLQDANAKYDSLKSEYDAYKEKMKPYEDMEAAEAEQRTAAAKAAQTETDNENAATTAVGKVWNFTAGTLADGATRDLYNDAVAKVALVTDENVKNSLNQAVAAADAALGAQEQAAAAEAAKGYETGITYDQLARTPDDYIAKKVKFTGKVVQVIDGGSTIQIRLAVNDDYDTILLGEYSSSIVSSRILENDEITIYGMSIGTISYQSTMGGTITIPGVSIEKIDP